MGLTHDASPQTTTPTTQQDLKKPNITQVRTHAFPRGPLDWLTPNLTTTTQQNQRQLASRKWGKLSEEEKQAYYNKASLVRVSLCVWV